jgi:DNA invertase Pin-like site-specific DNA recombinase
MIRSELITPHHLSHTAIIYVRQSTPQQMLSNQESLRLQYALQQRALELGWQICGFKNCLIADRDGIYDPGSPNGRLLLELKGQLSEMELHTIRACMTAGLLNKAARGELALRLPIGLVRDASGQVHKDPELEIQARLELIFSTFPQLKAASKVLRFFNDHELLIPRHDRFGDLVWKKPTVAAILATLKNPAYAGAFVYQKRSQSRPRRVAGYLTVPQIASALDVTPHWIYHLIDNRRMQVTKNAQTGLYLFPDKPETLAMFNNLNKDLFLNFRCQEP